MEMNDKTILRIKVPAHLYESVKAQLTLNEAKGKRVYGAGMEEVKQPKTPKAASERPENTSAHKKKEKRNAPVQVHKGESPGDNIPNADKDIPGMGLTEKNKMGLEEFKALYELLGNKIQEMEGAKEEVSELRPGGIDDEDSNRSNRRNRNYRSQGGRGFSQDDFKRWKSGEYSDDEITKLRTQQDDEDAGRKPQNEEDDSKKKVKEAIDLSVGLPIKGNILWVTSKVKYMIETAIENGQQVKINGETVSSVDPKYNKIYTETGEEYQLQVLKNLSAITIDGKHIADIDPKVSAEIERIAKEYEPTFKKPEYKPQPADPDAAKKAGEEWMKRYGPGGGQETYAGRYTGD